MNAKSRETELIKLAKLAVNGDTESVNELLKHVGPYIFKRALSLTGNYHDSEDIRQEVMIRIHTNIRKIKKPETYFGWQERIIRNTVTDHYRSRMRKRKADESFNNYHPGILSELPDAILEEKDNLQKVRDVFVLLTPREQTAFFLREYEGMKAGNIARLMNVKDSTARVLYSKASAKIISHLRKLRTKGAI